MTPCWHRACNTCVPCAQHHWNNQCPTPLQQPVSDTVMHMRLTLRQLLSLLLLQLVLLLLFCVVVVVVVFVKAWAKKLFCSYWYGIKCFFGYGGCGYSSGLRGSILVGFYVVSNIGGGLLLRFSDGATFTAIVNVGYENELIHTLIIIDLCVCLVSHHTSRISLLDIVSRSF